MSFSVDAFYTIADQLHHGHQVSSAQPECIRTVAGRLYYAAYLSTVETFRTIVGKSEYRIDHSDLVQFLRVRAGARDPWIAIFGEELLELKQLRHDADYYPNKVVSYRDVGGKFRNAKRLVNEQNELLTRLKALGIPLPPPSQHG